MLKGVGIWRHGEVLGLYTRLYTCVAAYSNVDARYCTVTWKKFLHKSLTSHRIEPPCQAVALQETFLAHASTHTTYTFSYLLVGQAPRTHILAQHYYNWQTRLNLLSTHEARIHDICESLT